MINTQKVGVYSHEQSGEKKTTGQENMQKGDRLYFFDNLKTFIIFLVVVFHAGYVYEQSGILSSVWIVDDPAKNSLPGILNLIMDMFLMPTLFFISGYFAPLSLHGKKGWTFISSRFKRLMVPWMIAVLTLLPLYKSIFLFSRGLPQGNLTSYFHFSGGILINQGWLWFLPVLFMFDVVYFLLSKMNRFGLKFSINGAILTTFFAGFIYSFSMSFFTMYGWTKTILLDFQNERLFIYLMIFLLGSLFFKLNVFQKRPASKVLYYVLCATCWIPMNLYIIFLVNLFVNPGQYIFSEIVDLILIWLGFHLTLLSLLYLIINTFRYYFNRAGRLMKALNEFSYGVYIIHFIVMGGIAAILLQTTIPSIPKYAVLALSAFAVSNLIMAVYKNLWRSAEEKWTFLGERAR